MNENEGEEGPCLPKVMSNSKATSEHRAGAQGSELVNGEQQLKTINPLERHMQSLHVF